MIARVVGVALVAALATACDTTPPKPRLKASLKLGQALAIVTNEDNQDWQNVRLSVNDKFLCPTIDAIEASKRDIVSLATCTSLDGERFVPATMAPANVVITAVLVVDGGEAVAGFTQQR